MIDRLLFQHTDNTLVQLFRYTLVGGLAFVVDFSTLYLLTEYAGLHYLLSATVGFLIGLVVNYLISVQWIFHQRRFAKRSVEFTIYGWIGVIGIGLNLAIMWLLTEQMQLHYLGSKAVSAVVVFLWNFFARKRALFA
ncbi:MAG: GtrA family protein [Sedimenticola sp.]